MHAADLAKRNTPASSACPPIKYDLYFLLSHVAGVMEVLEGRSKK
jgi:hypothetical protein